MYVDRGFVDSLNIPSNAWLTTSIHNQPHLVLHSEKYCPRFWVTLAIQEIGRSRVPYFVPNSLPYFNLQQQVYINQNTHELLLPPSILSSEFWREVFIGPRYSNTSLFHRLPSHVVLNTSIVFVLVVVIGTLLARYMLVKGLNIVHI